MAKLSGKRQKVKAILDAIGQRLGAGERFDSNEQFETEIKALGYSYKEAEGLIVELAPIDVRNAYIESFKGHLPLELKRFQRYPFVSPFFVSLNAFKCIAFR